MSYILYEAIKEINLTIQLSHLRQKRNLLKALIKIKKKEIKITKKLLK